MTKRIALMVFLLMTLFSMSPYSIYAWDTCLKDVFYIDEYQFNIEAGNVMRGQAIVSVPHQDYPAPLTGYFNPVANTYSFSIGYLISNATRHYRINVSTLKGHTWGILFDSSFYDGPRAATLGPCGPQPTTGASEGETGAPE